jgi:hypothetical protein
MYSASGSHVSLLPINHSELKRHGETDTDLEGVNTKEKYRSGISTRRSRAMRWKRYYVNKPNVKLKAKVVLSGSEGSL